jgi:hypothetical protein
MMSLAYSITLGDNNTISTFYRAAHIWLQFCAMNLSILMDGINLAIVIEKYAQVIDISLHVLVLPRTTDIFGSITLQPFSIYIRKEIELSVSISYGRCPDALTVYLLMIL